MMTSVLTREQAAERRREAADAQATELHKREGGSRLRFVEHQRILAPKDLGFERQVGFKASVRSAPRLERRNGQDMFHVTGHASVVDTPYEMWDFFGPYDEIVHNEAFDRTLAAKPDVVFVVNHTGLTMARSVVPPMQGDFVPTLELAMGMLDEYNGLVSDAWLNSDPVKRPDVAMLMSAIDDKLITEMSFKFMIVQGRWSEDFMTYVIAEVDIDRGDVSAVNYGANPNTTIAARTREWMEMARYVPRGAKIAMQERLAQDVDVMDSEVYQPVPAQATRSQALEEVFVANPDMDYEEAMSMYRNSL